MSPKTPFTITYNKPGTVPPVFLAGSFSDPQWQPQEMECITDQNGEHTFQSEVMLEPEQDYQFKLRIGHDNWWVLAENYPTATDDSGNENNLVRVQKPAEEQIAPAGIDTPEIKLNPATQSTVTPSEVNNVDGGTQDSNVPLFAHESPGHDVEEDAQEDNAENKAPLFAHESLGNDVKDEDSEDFKAPLFAHESLVDDSKDESEEMKMPLFAHECLGAYDFGEDPEHDNTPNAISSPGQTSKVKTMHDKTAELDVNDPTLESFPSDRGSILGTIRSIQTHLGEDQTHLDDIPSSPRVISSRRTSLDSNDDLCLPPASLSPTVTRRRDSRPSHSFGRTRSAVSLGSIEEEPKPSSNRQSKGPPVVSLPNPHSRDKLAGQKSPPSEEDEAVVMKTSEVKPSAKTNGESPSQVESYPAQNTQHEKAPTAATTEQILDNTQSKAVDGQANDAPLAAKSVEYEASSGSELKPAYSLQDAEPAPNPKSNKAAKKTAPSGGSSQPPRKNVVPIQRLASQHFKPRPSRMVLSDRVGQAPPSRDDRQRRRDAPGPFGGMNRRVANIDPARRAGRQRAVSGNDSRGSNTRERDNRRGGTRDGDDRKALKMQRALATVSYGKRMMTKDILTEYDTFDNFDLIPVLQAAVNEELFKGMVDIKPTPVQKLAIPALIGQKSPDDLKRPTDEMRSFLLAAETGSGKTLAYLLPAVDALKTAEAADPELKAYRERWEIEKQRQLAGNSKGKPLDEPHPTMARPKVVILVPTAELAHQVTKTSKSISHVAKYKTELLSSDLRPQQIQRNLYGPRGVDIIVSTPHLLASIADSDPNILSRVTHLIVDEADSLFDRSFAPVTTSIVERAMPSLKQFVCCSATIPRKLNNYLATNYPKMTRITTPNLHAIPRRVQLGVIDVSREPYRNNKDLACADAIYSIGREASNHEGPVKGEVDVRRIMVFVNEREKTEELAEYLREKGINADALHRDTPEKRHGEILETFTSPDPLRIPTPTLNAKKRSLPNVRVLVVTDLASRGIDTLAVRHVILYHVPHTTIDFIHRLGRAGRMGRRGRGIVLVGNDDRKDVVAEVKNSMFRGTALI
ncbi:hypothetical protein HYE67_007318 [Fusarium culmorum]|uniref:RNA helicase n=1 Tax=Fusarium culmorum TaxID=5516 RepID=A0A7S8DAV3_FUSCU|nr:hypothetical protein HYE67_007318 [Fusarium culmorum]